MGAGDQRAHLAARPAPVTDMQFGHPRADLADKLVADLANGHHDRDGHAPLARRAETRRDRGVRRQVEVGVRQDNHVVLRAPNACTRLRAGCRLVPRTGRSESSRQRDRLHHLMGQQPVDRDLSPCST